MLGLFTYRQKDTENPRNEVGKRERNMDGERQRERKRQAKIRKKGFQVNKSLHLLWKAITLIFDDIKVI